jgi:hypothetical protein
MLVIFPVLSIVNLELTVSAFWVQLAKVVQLHSVNALKVE